LRCVLLALSLMIIGHCKASSMPAETRTIRDILCGQNCKGFCESLAYNFQPISMAETFTSKLSPSQRLLFFKEDLVNWNDVDGLNELSISGLSRGKAYRGGHSFSLNDALLKILEYSGLIYQQPGSSAEIGKGYFISKCHSLLDSNSASFGLSLSVNKDIINTIGKDPHKMGKITYGHAIRHTLEQGFSLNVNTPPPRKQQIGRGPGGVNPGEKNPITIERDGYRNYYQTPIAIQGEK